MRGHIGQRLAGGVGDRRRDPGRDDRSLLAVDIDVNAQPAAAQFVDHGQHRAGQVAGLAPGPRGRIVLVAERVLDEGDVLAAPVHRPGRVFGPGPGQGGERVEDRVVQQALCSRRSMFLARTAYCSLAAWAAASRVASAASARP